MIKVMQYGQGNFLRAFVDHYFNTLNKEGLEYSVDIVVPINMGSIESFVKQENKYNVVLRGFINNKSVEDIYHIECVNSCLNPFNDYDKYMALSLDKDLKVIVSNTTEAGICFNENDSIDGFDGITYPAKLTKFLYSRYNANLEGLYVLPVELIEDNATVLHQCVLKYIDLWNLPIEFKNWIENEVYFVNTLVDRIVSGYPRDEETKNHLCELVGYNDELIDIGEPFGLWAIEKKGNIDKYIKEGHHGIDVVLTTDIAYYKKRKVRVLNGSHTNMIPMGLMFGLDTVYDCMYNEEIKDFFEKTLNEEIIPFVSSDINMTKSFAESVKERFMNPYLNHQLVSILLNSISKWPARCMPSFVDYYEKYHKIPKYLTIGFSYMVALYKKVYKKDGKYFADLVNKTIEVKDNVEYLEFFINNGSIKEFLMKTEVFGQDMTKYVGFESEVEKNVNDILLGKKIF